MLKDLLLYAGEVTGIHPTNDETRAQLLLWINRAAQELWDSWDLPNSLMEQTFYLGDAATDSNVWLVTLPWYVGTLRAARFAMSMDVVKFVDMRPRYFNRPWKQPLLQWRIIGQTPLLCELPADTQLVIERGGDETEPFSVSVRGATGASNDITETMSFIFGGSPELIIANSTNSYRYLTHQQWAHDNPMSIRSITKDRQTVNDVQIYSNDPYKLVATIPNKLERANNTIVQLHDDSKGIFNTSADILFKWPYLPLVEDSDEFAVPQLEQAIIWMLRSHWYSTKEGKANESMLSMQKCLDLVQRVCGRTEEAAERRIQFAPNNYEFAPLTSYPFRYGRRT